LLEVPEILYRPIEQFWFLYVLFLLTVAFGLLLKFGIRPWTLVIIAAVLYPGIWPLPWSGWAPFEISRSNAIYLTLGVIVGANHFYLLDGAGERTLAAVAAVGLLTVSSLAIFLETSHPHLLDFVLAASGSAGVVALAVLANRAKIDSAISFLGRYSLEIFVVHTIASAAIRILLQQYWLVTAPALYIVFCTIGGLYGPIFVAIALKRMGFRWAFAMPKRNGPNNLKHSENLASNG
jgi:hypothetical protein